MASLMQARVVPQEHFHQQHHAAVQNRNRQQVVIARFRLTAAISPMHYSAFARSLS
jgi:hypothetical protein